MYHLELYDKREGKYHSEQIIYRNTCTNKIKIELYIDKYNQMTDMCIFCMGKYQAIL